MKRKILSVLLVIIMLCIPASFTAYGASEDFSGTREIVFTVDRSDLNNYIDGGRTQFDLLMRMHSPDWLNYSMHTANRDLELTLSFSFESYSDYIEKLSALLTHSPSVIRDDDILIECHKATEFLNFLQSILGQYDFMRELNLYEFFRISRNSITLNSQEYTFDDFISVGPEKEEVIKVNYLEMETYYSEEEGFVRKIETRIYDTHKSDAQKLYNRFSGFSDNVDISENDSSAEVSVRLTTSTLKELSVLSMQCLGVVVSAQELQTYVDDSTVGIQRTEFIDLEKLLWNDTEESESEFYYTFKFPESMRNTSSTDEEVSCNEERIYTDKKSGVISFSYERGLMFTDIDVTVDYSSLIAKPKISISFSLPSDIASHYHEILKSRFSERLEKGMTLDIYDDFATRVYKISYTSFFPDDIEKFCHDITDTRCTYSAQSSFFPYSSTEITQQLDFSETFADMEPAENVTYNFVLPSVSSSKMKTDPKKGITVSKNKIIVSGNSANKIYVPFSSLNLPYLVIYLLVFLILLILFLIIRRKIRQAKKKRIVKQQNPVAGR